MHFSLHVKCKRTILQMYDITRWHMSNIVWMQGTAIVIFDDMVLKCCFLYVSRLQ